MEFAELEPRLRRCARYWLHRHPWARLLIEPEELVAEGWLAWERARYWKRAEGAMRDRLRQLWRQSRRERPLEDREPLEAPESGSRVQVPVLIEIRPAALIQRDPAHDYARDCRILEARARGELLTTIAARENLGSAEWVGQIHRRALRRLEGSEIARRRPKPRPRGAPLP